MSKQKWSVALHGHASARVEVVADSYREACRAALQVAPRVPHVKEWSPVMASRLPETPEGN